MFKKYRSLFLLAFDTLVIVISYYVALWLRLDFSFGGRSFFDGVTRSVPLIIIVSIIVLKLFKVDKTLWRQQGVPEAVQVASALVTIYAINAALIILVFDSPFPRSIHLIGFIIGVLAIEFSRFFYRIYRHYEHVASKEDPLYKKTLIIGSGDAGLLLLKEIMNNTRYRNNVIGFVDDNKYKVGKMVSGVSVLGTTDDLEDIVEAYHIELIYIAIPSASVKTQNELVNKSHELGVEVKILGRSENMLSGYDVKKNIRPISIGDLLGRKEVELDNDEIIGIIENQVVLVTGAAGSIGSELCRQLLKFNPLKLIMIDVNENSLHDLQQTFNINKRDKLINQEVEIVSLIVSIRDKIELENVFRSYKPSIIFHAAAHKHVPFMEDTPSEAIRNNVFGTYNLIELSKQYGVKNFVSISTDKAVNPTNVMGATKRFVEKMIQSQGQESGTKFVAVRFGNVLGSNGSVVPLFTKQIENGGPVTVTHKDMVRFFMTIPEAVSLVIQAATYGNGGELFVLDMGEPVKILDLAEKMIRLAGYVPYEEIDIIFTGLRPGEKLYEEVLMDEEDLRPTANKLIFIAKPMDISKKEVMDDLDKLDEIVSSPHTRDEVIESLKDVVETYQPNVINREGAVTNKQS